MPVASATGHREPAEGLRHPAAPPVSARHVLTYLGGGALVTFAASFLLSDRLGLHHDLYLLLYMTFALAYLGWFGVTSGLSPGRLLTAHLWWSLTVGAVVGTGVVAQVMGQTGTAHPRGAFFAFELVWRGVVYGVVDALVLAVFPASLAYLALHGNRNGFRRKAAFAALTVLFSLVVSTTYHLGYSTYRGNELSKPLIGTVMWDVPAVATGNPAGALVAHAALHTSAVVHQYYGGDNHLLPPELTAGASERAGGAAAPALAAGWLVLLVVVLAVTRSHLPLSPEPPPTSKR